MLSRQCLDRRIPDADTLIHEVAAWEEPRNSAHATMEWRFTTAEAHMKHKHLYPVIHIPEEDHATPPAPATAAAPEAAA